MSAPGAAFTPGQSVTITASGAAVPRFSGTVTAPEMGSPSLPTTIVRGTNVTVTWPGTLAAEEVTVGITPVTTPENYIGCRLSAAASSLEVDGALTSMLPIGGARVTFNTLNTMDVIAGTYSIAVQAGQGSLVTATVM